MAQVREWHQRVTLERTLHSWERIHVPVFFIPMPSLIVANRSATSNCWQRHWLAGWNTFGLSLSGPSSQNWKYTKYTRYFRSSSSWFEYTSQSKILPSNVKTCILLWRICEVFSHQFPHFWRRICLWTATIICSYRLMLLSGRAIYIDAVEYFDVTFFWCSRLLLASSTRLSVSSLPADNHLHLSQPNTGTHPPTHWQYWQCWLRNLPRWTFVFHHFVSSISNLCLGQNRMLLEVPCSLLGSETSSGTLPVHLASCCSL